MNAGLDVKHSFKLVLLTVTLTEAILRWISLDTKLWSALNLICYYNRSDVSAGWDVKPTFKFCRSGLLRYSAWIAVLVLFYNCWWTIVGAAKAQPCRAVPLRLTGEYVTRNPSPCSSSQISMHRHQTVWTYTNTYWGRQSFTTNQQHESCCGRINPCICLNLCSVCNFEINKQIWDYYY
jgi:hypothetical protein